MDMLHKVSGTSMEESVESNKQSDYVEEPISPPTVGTEPSNDSQNQSAMESQPVAQNQPTTHKLRAITNKKLSVLTAKIMASLLLFLQHSDEVNLV